MSKPTPGKHSANKKYTIIRGGVRYFPIHAEKHGLIALTFREADAILYAAAPELLESVHQLLRCMELAGWENDDAAIFARAAISKATK